MLPLLHVRGEGEDDGDAVEALTGFTGITKCSRVTHLLGHLPDALNAGAVQVAVVLARLDEPMALDVFLHLFPRRHKVIVSPVHLIFPFGPRGVCQKMTKIAVRALSADLNPVRLLRGIDGFGNYLIR